MLILGIDTATPWGTIALAEDNELIFEISLKVAKGGGEYLIAMLEQLFEKVGRKMEEIKLIAAGLGPGSYTGIRVGLAAAAGLAEGLQVPVVGLNTLRIIAENARYSSSWTAVALDARRGEVYGALYHWNNSEVEEVFRPQAVKAEILAAAMKECGQVVLCGDGGKRYPEFFAEVSEMSISPERWDRPNAALAIEIARQKWNAGEVTNAVCLVPEYLKRVEAEIRLEEKKGGANNSSANECSRS